MSIYLFPFQGEVYEEDGEVIICLSLSIFIINGKEKDNSKEEGQGTPEMIQEVNIYLYLLVNVRTKDLSKGEGQGAPERIQEVIILSIYLFPLKYHFKGKGHGLPEITSLSSVFLSVRKSYCLYNHPN